ncbi:MAG: acyltransferase [Ileibacterium sp.]|nr:acyltransferase [Ileibacterium sp.]
MVKDKYYSAIDIAKYVSALLVVAVHTYPLLEINAVLNTFFIGTICRLAVPFFFCASGYFLFRKMNGDEKRDQNRIIRYLYRIGQLYLVWTVIYLPYVIWDLAQSKSRFRFILGWVRDFFLCGSYYHLWFLPALMLGIVIVYALVYKKGMKGALFAVLGLYFVGYLINIYGPIWETLPVIHIVYGFFTKTMVTARNGIFFAPMFLFIGMWIARKGANSFKASAIGFGISFLCLILEVSLYYAMGILQDLSCMYLSLIPCIWFLMQMLLRWELPYKPSYNELRQDSILIYVSQILFTRIFLILLPDAHLVVYMLTLACCQMFAQAVVKYRHKFPWLNYLM